MSEVQKFTDLDLIAPIARAVAEEGYEIPTPIQALSIPHLLKGRDLLGCAQTGTGKTAAFALPVLQGLEKSRGRKRGIRALIMTPTRELAAQIGDSFQTYGRHLSLTSTVIFGGVGQGAQEKALRRGPDILVATPGRLLDLMGQKLINLQQLEYFILDEADRMLDMGFIHDVRRVIDTLPEKRQSLFFSATMPSAVAKLADRLLTNPVRVEVTPQLTTAERIDEALMFVDKNDKHKLLETLLQDTTIRRTLVFSRTKHGADRLCKQLVSKNIVAGAIHGNKSQNVRTRALEEFRTGKLRVLVATDIAARGIDVDGITHVINFDLPNEPESYVHRIGRTARAGRAGNAISFCSGDELGYLGDIERIIKRKVPVDRDHAFHSEDAANGLEDGVPAQSPCKRQARKQAERAGRRRETGARPARHSSQRQSAKIRRSKRPKGAAPVKSRRRRARRRA
jgi:ATP-dependent RNA helicase RhlE